MKRFRFKILARRLHAIGKHWDYVEEVEAASYDEALLKLYDKYESIRVVLSWEVLPPSDS